MKPAHRFEVRRANGDKLAYASGFEAAASTASRMSTEVVVIVVHDVRAKVDVASFGGGE